MKRVAVVVLVLLVASSCSGDSERRLASTFDASKAALRRGELVEARALAERGLSLTRPDSEWALDVSALSRRDSPPAATAVGGAAAGRARRCPAARRSTELRARQKFLEARLQLTQNRFADALATLEAARHVAPGARDIQFDIAWLDGQIRMRLGKWSEAESRLNDVIARAAAAGDHYQQARALNDLGMGGFIRGRWDEALQRFERVLSFRDLEQLTVYAAALNNAGMCYARLGEFDRAVADAAPRRRPPHGPGAARRLRACAGRARQHASSSKATRARPCRST